MFELILGAGILVLLIVLVFLGRAYLRMGQEYQDMVYAKKSQSVKYGQLTEQWIPFSKNYPYDPQQFRFIGKPVDGVAFENDKIVFVEFKTNTSQLSEAQKRVKRLVSEKKVEWLELRAE